MSETPDVPVAGALARHALALRQRPLPEAAQAAVRRAITDWLGAAIAGSGEPPAAVLAGPLTAGSGPSRLVGSDRRADPSVAALVNGTAAHTLELDDIYAPGLFHPGAPVIAAALAVADQQHATGSQLRHAVLVGYEVGNRVATDLGPAHYAGWHTTGTAGSVGAAAAVAEVLKCDEERFTHALCLAATMAGGLQQTFRRDAMGKPLHAGHAAQAGVVAALAAHGGLTGAPDVFEGEVGMGAVMADRPDWRRARTPFGPDFLVQHTTVKPYPCCGHTFAPADAALALRSAGIRPPDIAAVEVHTYGAAISVAGIPAPAGGPEARFSIPFVVASALRDGYVAMDTFGPEALADAERAALAARVALRADPEFEAAFPARRGARVDVVDVDGARRTATVADRRGSPENPLPDAQVEEKSAAAAAPVVGRQRAVELLRGVRQLPGLSDVTAFATH